MEIGFNKLVTNFLNNNPEYDIDDIKDSIGDLRDDMVSGFEEDKTRKRDSDVSLFADFSKDDDKTISEDDFYEFFDEITGGRADDDDLELFFNLLDSDEDGESGELSYDELEAFFGNKLSDDKLEGYEMKDAMSMRIKDLDKYEEDDDDDDDSSSSSKSSSSKSSSSSSNSLSDKYTTSQINSIVEQIANGDKMLSDYSDKLTKSQLKELEEKVNDYKDSLSDSDDDDSDSTDSTASTDSSSSSSSTKYTPGTATLDKGTIAAEAYYINVGNSANPEKVAAQGELDNHQYLANFDFTQYTSDTVASLINRCQNSTINNVNFVENAVTYCSDENLSAVIDGLLTGCTSNDSATAADNLFNMLSAGIIRSAQGNLVSDSDSNTKFLDTFLNVAQNYPDELEEFIEKFNDEKDTNFYTMLKDNGLSDYASDIKEILGESTSTSSSSSTSSEKWSSDIESDEAQEYLEKLNTLNKNDETDTKKYQSLLNDIISDDDVSVEERMKLLKKAYKQDSSAVKKLFSEDNIEKGNQINIINMLDTISSDDDYTAEDALEFAEMFEDISGMSVSEYITESKASSGSDLKNLNNQYAKLYTDALTSVYEKASESEITDLNDTFDTGNTLLYLLAGSKEKSAVSDLLETLGEDISTNRKDYDLSSSEAEELEDKYLDGNSQDNLKSIMKAYSSGKLDKSEALYLVQKSCKANMDTLVNDFYKLNENDRESYMQDLIDLFGE
ncbi:MAG: hypothetical protein LUG16_07335 [Candidatus Gastranaerophilales bacterium]|nr:hypothetical protein [Candidatus Gastranaerophilales bacterium]